ncbi:MAG: hypothetical protein DRG78_22260 [Epsilonproteobacteria bacterium]|nr:MAG: hypothetical protein DRG78_22260 [Campylobacterota bacterium]
MEKLLLGIDFGTSTNFITRYDFKKGIPVEIANMGAHEKGNIFPNTIYIESEDNIILGDMANKKGLSDPMNYFSDIKRYISSDNWEHKIPHIDYKIHSAKDIATLIFKEIKNRVEKNENRKVDGVVLTVPYSYGDTYRRRLREAAVDADLAVLKIIEEPIAAAVSFGVFNNHSDVDEKILVFDFGGGTLDITVFKFTKHNQSNIEIEVLNTEGIENLGGKDIDNILVLKFKEILGIEFEEVNSDVELKQFQETLLKLASESKELLSEDDEEIYQNFIINNKNKELELDLEQKIFVKWLKINNIVGQIEDAIDRSLDDVGKDGIDPEEIDKIILVGGSSSIPLIYSTLEDYFGKAPMVQKEPDKLVGYGAGIIAGLTEDNSLNYEIIRKVSKDIGISKGNRFEPILRKNSTYGTESEIYFIDISKSGDNEQSVKLSFYEGDSSIIEDCEKIGILDMEKNITKIGIALSRAENDGRLKYHLYDEHKTLIETNYIEYRG